MASTEALGKRWPWSTHGCSVEPARRNDVPAPPFHLREGDSTRLLASVPPLVKITFLELAPTRAATRSRAVSISARAARPSAWTDEALPVIWRARTSAAATSGRSGAVAL